MLGALVLALLAYLVVVLVRGAAALPGTSPAEHAEDSYGSVRAATRGAVLAFLHVDYRNMDAVTGTVVHDSTGKFRKQYAATRVNLKAAAQSARATSHGRIRYVGVSQLAGDQVGDRATTFVAADSVVRNKSSKKAKPTKSCPHQGAVCRYYRFRIQLTRTDDGWKMSGLDFVS